MDKPSASRSSGWRFLFVCRKETALLVTLLILSSLSLNAQDEKDLPLTVPRNHFSNAIHLTEQQQKAGGVSIRSLESSNAQAQLLAYGKVLDVHALLDFRARYRSAEAEIQMTATALELARKNRLRLSTLHREDIIAGRELAQADAQYQTDQARHEIAQRLLREIRQQAQQSWGDELTHLALDGHSPLFEDWVSRKKVLLLITLPDGHSLPKIDRSLWIALDQTGAQKLQAEWIAAAPKTDELVQGETYFFHAPADRLRIGMRVNAWVPLAGETWTGVLVPRSAIVWWGGRPWVYRQVAANTLIRSEITEYREYAGAWLVSRGVVPGDQIVVIGGQMLLSEEFRGQIPEEDRSSEDDR
jgi:hypothetical protein